MTINTNQNKLFGEIILGRGSKPKAVISPNENLKTDLGSNQKKIKNLYVNNLRSSSSEIIRGSWSPNFIWSKSITGLIPLTGTQKPNYTIIEAKYQKIGNEVNLFANFSTTGGTGFPSSEENNLVYGSLTNLPFPNVMTANSPSFLLFALKNIRVRGWRVSYYPSTNIYNYTNNYTTFYLSDTPAYLRSNIQLIISATSADRIFYDFCLASTNYNTPVTKYFCTFFSYTTNDPS